MKPSPPPITLLVTDLDNTLYDWITFFVSSFYEMVRVAARQLAVPEEQLLDELRAVHCQHHNTEHPFALLETPSVAARYPDATRRERLALLGDAFAAFDRVRERTLMLYPGTRETLAAIQASGCRIVAYTEAAVTSAMARLEKLHLLGFIERLYAAQALGDEHPRAERAAFYRAQVATATVLEIGKRKPDADILLGICRDQDTAPEETLYVGDSLSRDVGMAKTAGVWSAWARYGTCYGPELWPKLVRVTHWTEHDVAHAERTRELYRDVTPDVTLEHGPAELLAHFHFTAQAPPQIARG